MDKIPTSPGESSELDTREFLKAELESLRTGLANIGYRNHLAPEFLARVEALIAACDDPSIPLDKIVRPACRALKFSATVQAEDEGL